MKFPNLPAAGPLTGTEVVPITQAGVDKRTTTQDLANLAAPDASQIPFANSNFSATNVEDAIIEASGGGAGSGDVVGPASSTNNVVAVFDGTTGKLLKDGATYSGQTSITTLGTVATGTWNATAISAVNGGTGQTGYAVGDLLYASSTTALSKLTAGTNGHVLTLAAGVPIWAAGAASVTSVNGDTGAVIVAAPICIACGDEITALTTGAAKVTFRMPYAFTLTGVRASVTTAPTGSVLTVDINETGTTILSTKITIDATEKTSTTAATPPVISDSALADDAEITIDIDTVGSTTAGAGLKVWLIGYAS